METALTVPLLISQIEAANKLHQQLLQWQITDRALYSLRVRFPEFDNEATLLKVVAVNQLYGTNIYAVTRIARHITKIMPVASELEDFDLVEQIASFSGKKHLSFASKFAHFFIDMERFPIYDSFAVKMVAYHLGKQGQTHSIKYPYKAFIENIDALKKRANLSCTNKELDRYLWLAGLYQSWHKNRAAPINREVVKLFESPPLAIASELANLSPSST